MIMSKGWSLKLASGPTATVTSVEVGKGRGDTFRVEVFFTPAHTDQKYTAAETKKLLAECKRRAKNIREWPATKKRAKTDLRLACVFVTPC